MDKNWIHHFTPLLNRPSIEWKVAGESRPTLPKSQTSAGRGLVSVFCAKYSFFDYIEKGQTINSEYYKQLLVRVMEEIAKKGHKWRRKECSFTKTKHKSIATMAKLLWIASLPTLFFRSGPKGLLTVCRPKQNTSGKEIWLQWRNDIGNWGVFWG